MANLNAAQALAGLRFLCSVPGDSGGRLAPCTGSRCLYGRVGLEGRCRTISAGLGARHSVCRDDDFARYHEHRQRWQRQARVHERLQQTLPRREEQSQVRRNVSTRLRLIGPCHSDAGKAPP